jgi:hypothetical protein
VGWRRDEGGKERPWEGDEGDRHRRTERVSAINRVQQTVSRSTSGDEFAKSSRLLCFAFRRAPGHIATVAAPTPQQQHALTCAIAANHSPEAVHRSAGTYSAGYNALLPTERPISPPPSPLTCPDQSARRKTPLPSNKPRSSMPTESIGHPTQSAGLSLADARSWCASSALISPLTTLTEPHTRR